MYLTGYSVAVKPVVVRELREYLTEAGVSPFERWFRGVKDAKTQAVVRKRLDRVALGNFGDCKAVGEGVSELRIDYGPGYRIYLGEDGDVLVILLCAGNKATQAADIRRAKEYWAEYWSDHAEANTQL